MKVDKLELYAAENAQNHKTDKYCLVDEDVAVLRRGREFFLAVIFTDDNVEESALKVIFDFGRKPSVPKGTRVVLGVHDDECNGWKSRIFRRSQNRLILQISISSSAAVGEWKCKIEIGYATFENDKSIYVLFNPYCPDDGVFMPRQHDLAEYLQNDVGKVWKGSYKRFSGRHWAFGRFDLVALPAACLALDRTRLNDSDRGNPVRVARALSAAVNFCGAGDSGILAGRWSPPYDDGVSPWEWTGSVDILRLYLESNGDRPVKYGQCWVFSALVVTLCRALGIACRSVTNYVSAHDTNHSLTVDKFFDKEGDERDVDGHDSIWNFHVWNDVWMARPDLPRGYSGWQAIDATPQELSDNEFRCGPAPVEAIRRGEVGLGFDVPFLFAEVNADICHFVEDENSKWGYKRVKLDKYHVGRLILTKAPTRHDHEGDDDAQDITHVYKNAEGTGEERLAVFNAIRGVDKAALYYDETDNGAREDVFMDLQELERIQYGQPYTARIWLHNKSGETRTLKALVSSSSLYYTGVSANLIKKAKGEFRLRPGQRDSLALDVRVEDYAEKLVDYCLVKIRGLIRVLETGQMWTEEDDFVLEKPRLSIEVVTPKQIRIRLKNPLHVPLTNCALSLECAGLGVRRIKERLESEIAPGAVLVHSMSFAPKTETRKATLVVVFQSNEMIDVCGSAAI